MTPESQIRCPISNKPMEHVFSETVLGKHLVKYFYCDESGLLKTEPPYWLEEAYQDAIADTDTGIVNRNINYSRTLEAVIECLGIKNGTFLDVAGGYGLLARLLRDKGFDCYTTDKYCKNLFAKTFEPQAGFKADAMFAFEVLEHIEDPMQFFSEIFAAYGCRTIVFSTLVFSQSVPSRDWWYYSFEAGQHISFYQARTLAMLADRLGCGYFMLNPGLHLITDRKISKATRVILSSNKLRKLYSYYARLKPRAKSKTVEDHLKMKDQLRNSKT
ncbi:MAG: class I SAM-dependent methyltransferase [Planctomycetota bacterium]|jgi:hypothetical protein